MTNDETRKNDEARNSNGWVGARVVHGWTWWPRNALEGIANESGCLPGGKGSSHVPVSRRDILRIARRFNAGKHPARHTSPEGTAEGCGVGLDLSRPFGTGDLLASNPALKRWAILACPFGTAKQWSFAFIRGWSSPVFHQW